MERRDFFRWGLAKVAGAAVDEAEARLNKNASRWFRPPFAVAELDFLLKCTRCDDCIKACPHDVLFPLPPQYGLQVVETPAMELLNTGCQMCVDWPCVAACPTGAMVLPGADVSMGDDAKEETPPVEGDAAALEVAAGALELPAPKLANAFIDTAACLPYLGPECGACADSCPIPNALTWDGPKPVIDQELCSGCAMCRQACIVEPKAVLIETVTREMPANE